MAINWGQGGPQNNALGYFQLGNQMGAQLRQGQRESERDSALAAYAMDPQAPGSMDGLIKADPRLAIQLRQNNYEQQQQAQQQRRADLPLLGRLLDQATDEPSYQQSRQIAQEYGIDVSQLPPNFDPQWVGQQRATIKALQDPTKMEALSTAGRIAMDLGFRPGTPEYNEKVGEIWMAGEAKPYVVGGETRLYTPRLGGAGQALGSSGPQPGTIEDGYRFKGGNPADPGSWEPATGGPAAAPQTPFAQNFAGFQARP